MDLPLNRLLIRLGPKDAVTRSYGFTQDALESEIKCVMSRP